MSNKEIRVRKALAARDRYYAALRAFNTCDADLFDSANAELTAACRELKEIYHVLPKKES